MELSHLVKKGIDHLIAYGDCDVRINLLTENQCNFLDEYHVGLYNNKHEFEFEISINSKDDLIQKIK